MGIHETLAKEIGTQTRTLNSIRKPLHFLQAMEVTKIKKRHSQSIEITQKHKRSLHGKTNGTHQKPLEAIEAQCDAYETSRHPWVLSSSIIIRWHSYGVLWNSFGISGGFFRFTMAFLLISDGFLMVFYRFLWASYVSLLISNGFP